jgi:hypothetical protein
MNPFNILISRTESYESQLPRQNKVDKEELHSWYTTKKTELLAIETEADGVDSQIDTEVYRLYGLNDEEIGVIEERQN